MDLEVMAKKGYSILLRIPELESHHPIKFNAIHRT